MRLLLISSEFPPGPGGIGTHAYQLARHLAKIGWEITVLTPQDYASEGEIETFNESQPFLIIRLRRLPINFLNLFYWWHLACKHLKTRRPDKVIASGDRMVYLTALLMRASHLPWIAVEHGRIPSRVERMFKRWFFQQAKAVVCVSQYTWRQMLTMGIRPRMGCIIPNGGDPAQFRSYSYQEVKHFRENLRLKASNLLVTVGNVTERKGQDVVIRALPRILQKKPNTHYLIIGLPTRKRQFAKLAAKLGVDSYVHFLGALKTSSLVHYLNACDIFVMTSKHAVDSFEGYGIAVVEAALCGKPAVVSTDSGLPEAIVEKKTGFSVPQDDEVTTAEKILFLLESDEERQRMGEAARRRALEEQTWEKRVREYDVMLHKISEIKTKTIFIGMGKRTFPIPIHFSTLGRELAAKGHKVHLLIHHHHPIAIKEGDPIEHFWPWRKGIGRIRDFFMLSRMTLKYRPSCVIAAHRETKMLILVGFILRVPIRILYYHTLTTQIDLDTKEKPWRVRLYRITRIPLYKWFATHIIAVSKAASLDVQKHFFAPQDRCHVFYNSIADTVRSDFSINLKERPEENIICAGRLDRSKGQDVLIRAVALLKPSYPKIHIRFYGDGKFKDALCNLTASLKLEKSCSFLGQTSHKGLMREMQNASLTVVPSRSEAFGCVAIESMAAGVPVVGARVDGITEIIRDGIDGRLFMPGNHVDLAHKLDGLLSKQNTLLDMSENARKHFLEHFEERKAVTVQAKWLDSLLNRD